MSWGVLFRIRQYLKGSLWFFPLIGAILGPLAAVIVHQADGAAAQAIAGAVRRVTSRPSTTGGTASGAAPPLQSRYTQKCIQDVTIQAPGAFHIARQRGWQGQGAGHDSRIPDRGG